MITMCDSADDQHAPFPHRLVTVEIHKRRVKFKPPEPKQVIVYVVCCQCDHWIGRIKGPCDCPYNCHSESDDDVAGQRGVGYDGSNEPQSSTRGKVDDSHRSDSPGQASAA